MSSTLLHCYTGHGTSYTFISQCVRHRPSVLHTAQHGLSMDTSDTTYRCTICLDTVLFQLIIITGSVSGLYSVFLETWKTTFFIWPGSNFWPGSVSACSWLKALSYLRHAKVILSLKGCNCENRWIVCSSRHDRLEAGCGDPYKVETHHALVYRSIVSGPPALLQLGYLHSIHYWARASNCFGLFAGSVATVGTHAYCRELELHRVSAEAATCPAWLHARHLLSCYLKPAACSA